MAGIVQQRQQQQIEPVLMSKWPRLRTTRQKNPLPLLVTELISQIKIQYHPVRTLVAPLSPQIQCWECVSDGFENSRLRGINFANAQTTFHQH